MEPLFPIRLAPSETPNAVLVIEPYRHEGAWVFDEPRVGLRREPFVAGVTEMIDRLVAGIPDAAGSFRLLFAAFPFEGYQAVLTWVRADPVEGNWYRAEDGGDEGWLCPALLWFFPEPPARIYVRAEPRPGTLRDSRFFVEFEVAGDDRFHQLVAAFDALREAKRSGEWRDDDYWLTFFDQRARSRFWWPTAEELKEWELRWLATPIPQRFTDPSLEHPWDFGSMIDAFRNGEYDLLRCRRVSATAGRLEFDPHAWPYGGTGCMRALVEAFGHRVVRVEE